MASILTDAQMRKQAKIPRWMDRSKLKIRQITNPGTGQLEKIMETNQELPSVFRRKVRRSGQRSRLRFLEKRETVQFDTPDGPIFAVITKPGDLRISRNKHPDGREVVAISGHAKYSFDRDMTAAMNPRYWKTG